jgi:hypothetical protein
LYRGIKMRSRLEADVARDLDIYGVGWTYEPQCFANEHGQYLPDFKVDNSYGTALYWEIKPISFPFEDIPPVLTRMSIIWDSDPSAILCLVLWKYGGPDETYAPIVRAEGPAFAQSDGSWWYFVNPNLRFPFKEAKFIVGGDE